MKNSCKIVFLFVLFIAVTTKDSFAQNRNIDSLFNLIKKDKPDTNNVNHLNKLASEYIHIGEYDNGLKYANKALELANTFFISNKKGGEKGISSAYNNIGNIYYRQGNYPEGLKNYLAALKIGESTGDKNDISSFLSNIGNVYYAQGNYPEALKNYEASLKIRV